MKTYTKKRQSHRRRRMQRSQKKVGGINWKFWEKAKPADVPAAQEQCPPCPVCDSTVHMPVKEEMPAEMPAPKNEMPAEMPADQNAFAPQLGGKNRRRRSRKSKKSSKKSWFQIGCKTMKF